MWEGLDVSPTSEAFLKLSPEYLREFKHLQQVGLSRATLEFHAQVFILIWVKSQVSFVTQLARYYLQEFNINCIPTWSRKLTITFRTPSRHLPNTIQTLFVPSKHLPRTLCYISISIKDDVPKFQVNRRVVCGWSTSTFHKKMMGTFIYIFPTTRGY